MLLLLLTSTYKQTFQINSNDLVCRHSAAFSAHKLSMAGKPQLRVLACSVSFINNFLTVKGNFCCANQDFGMLWDSNNNFDGNYRSIFQTLYAWVKWVMNNIRMIELSSNFYSVTPVLPASKRSCRSFYGRNADGRLHGFFASLINNESDITPLPLSLDLNTFSLFFITHRSLNCFTVLLRSVSTQHYWQFSIQVTSVKICLPQSMHLTKPSGSSLV